MAFQVVASLDADVTVALGKKDKKTGKPYPKQAEGYFLGSRTVESKRGENKLHFLQTAEGNLGIWGTTDLNRKLSQVPAGTMVRITSAGTKPTPNGDMYMYKVETDADNTIEVSAATESEGTDNSGSGVDEDDGSYAEADEDDSQAAALLAAEKAAKVQAIMNRGKVKSK